MRSRVVLPEPLEPINAWVCPFCTFRFTSLKAARFSKDFEMFCSSSMAFRCSGVGAGGSRLGGDHGDFDLEVWAGQLRAQDGGARRR